MFRRGGFVAGIIGKLSPWRENPLVTSLVGQLEAFAQAVRSGSSRSLASVVDGLAVMSTISAVRQSAMKGGSSCPVG
jgi:predicted dehydrogenase